KYSGEYWVSDGGRGEPKQVGRVTPCAPTDGRAQWRARSDAPYPPSLIHYSGELAFSFERLFQRGRGLRQDSVDLELLSLSCFLPFAGTFSNAVASKWSMNGANTAAPPTGRRDFFKKIFAGGIGALLALFPVGAGLAVFLDPLRRKSAA